VQPKNSKGGESSVSGGGVVTSQGKKKTRVKVERKYAESKLSGVVKMEWSGRRVGTAEEEEVDIPIKRKKG